MAVRFEIVVRGAPSPLLQAAAAGFVLDVPAEGQLRLIGSVADEAALHGVLQRLTDLRMDLVGVRRLSQDES